MARSVNRVILLGNCGQDPAIRFTPSGTISATFSLATSSSFKDAQGNWQEKTEWHHLVAFGKPAETARDYVKKGAKLYVEGKLQTRSWDKDGVTQYRTEVVVGQMVFTSEKGEASSSPAPATAVPPPRRTLTEELESTVITDEDVPPF